MDTTKYKDLIDIVYNSLKARLDNSSYWIRPEDSSSFLTLVTEKGVVDRVNVKNTKFDFTINNSANGEKLKYIFNVSISKVLKTKGFWKVLKTKGLWKALKTKGFWKQVDDSRYVTRISIRENTSWSTTEIEVYYLDTDKDKYNGTREIQFKMFNLLMETHTRKESEKENEKINGFISEIKKAADKAVMRDDKIDDILN
jgi:hypothetical protein